jgi:hypothetical protein
VADDKLLMQKVASSTIATYNILAFFLFKKKKFNFDRHGI